eukprot:TRINITY_DN8678_c0_g1_i6.p1 TRINITY_DN8678_c0_g1~~TRINITY_DN8678_c0_g1_i6.p1  ORF type:complete len:103 (-),score=8.72 TRINITY_DN8678_c0_g1_i6:655-963(-)
MQNTTQTSHPRVTIVELSFVHRKFSGNFNNDPLLFVNTHSHSRFILLTDGMKEKFYFKSLSSSIKFSVRFRYFLCLLDLHQGFTIKFTCGSSSIQKIEKKGK